MRQDAKSSEVDAAPCAHRRTTGGSSRGDPRCAIDETYREVILTKLRYGYQRIHVLLCCEGWPVNQSWLESACDPSCRVAVRRRPIDGIIPFLTAPTRSRSKDFVSDALFDGRRFRSLTVVDNFSRECLVIVVGQHLRGVDVVATLE